MLEILVENYVCVAQGEVKVRVVVTSVEVVGTSFLFVEGDTVRNKYWVGLVKRSEVQRIFECCYFIYR